MKNAGFEAGILFYERVKQWMDQMLSAIARTLAN